MADQAAAAKRYQYDPSGELLVLPTTTTDSNNEAAEEEEEEEEEDIIDGGQQQNDNNNNNNNSIIDRVEATKRHQYPSSSGALAVSASDDDDEENGRHEGEHHHHDDDDNSDDVERGRAASRKRWGIEEEDGEDEKFPPHFTNDFGNNGSQNAEEATATTRSLGQQQRRQERHHEEQHHESGGNVPLVVADLVDDGWRPAGWQRLSLFHQPPSSRRQQRRNTDNNNNNNDDDDSSLSRCRRIFCGAMVVVAILMLISALVGGICGDRCAPSARRTGQNVPPDQRSVCEIVVPLLIEEGSAALDGGAVSSSSTLFQTTTLLTPAQVTTAPSCMMTTTNQPQPTTTTTMSSSSSSLQTAEGGWYSIVGTGGVLQVSTCTLYTTIPLSLDVYSTLTTTTTGSGSSSSCDNNNNNDKANNNTPSFVCETTTMVDTRCSQDGAVAVAWLSTPGHVYYLRVLRRGITSSSPTVVVVGGQSFGLAVRKSPAMDFATTVYQNHVYAVTADSYGAREALGLVEQQLTPFTNSNVPTMNHSTFRVCGRKVQLAAVTSEEENNVIVDLGRNHFGVDAFLLLGGFQNPFLVEQVTMVPSDAARGWSWLTEGSFAAGNFTTVNNAYANWDDGEPNQSGDEDCLTVWTGNGKWHDRVCDNDIPFPMVLEVDLTRTAPLSIDGCSSLSLSTTNMTIPDPLVSVAMNDDDKAVDDAYVCRYLSDVIDEMVVAATSFDADFESRLMTLLGSFPDSLTPEMSAIIVDCVRSTFV